MATVKRRRRRRARLGELGWAELWDLLLADRWMKPHGPPGGMLTGGFSTPWERKAAWLAHREELLEDSIGQGHRPGAWWQFDSPGRRLTLEDGQEEPELAALVRLEAATPEEVRMFLRGFYLQYPEDPAERERLFEFQPQLRARWEHEQKLVEKLAGTLREAADDDDGA